MDQACGIERADDEIHCHSIIMGINNRLVAAGVVLVLACVVVAKVELVSYDHRLVPNQAEELARLTTVQDARTWATSS